MKKISKSQRFIAQTIWFGGNLIAILMTTVFWIFYAITASLGCILMLPFIGFSGKVLESPEDYVSKVYYQVWVEELKDLGEWITRIIAVWTGRESIF